MISDINVIISPTVDESNNIFLNTLRKYDVNIVDLNKDSEIMFIFLGKCREHNLDRQDWYYLERDYKINYPDNIVNTLDCIPIYVVAIHDDGNLYFREALKYDCSDDTIKLIDDASLFGDFLEKEFYLKEEASSYQSNPQKLRLLL